MYWSVHSRSTGWFGRLESGRMHAGVWRGRQGFEENEME